MAKFARQQGSSNDTITLPTSNFGEYITALAKRHNIGPEKKPIDHWAAAITRLAGDDVKMDNVEQMAVSLKREGVITGAQMGRLLAGHLREVFQSGAQGLRPRPWRCNDVFDPFGDFHTSGYLRNAEGEKDMEALKHLEHDHFVANVDSALNYLRSQKTIGYRSFLKVHEIIFGDFYPWAGTDRTETAPDLTIRKGDVIFANPSEIRMAMEHALEYGNDKTRIRKQPGYVMGMFAFAHPFLDGNGRTMLLVHAELCHRAGFSIAWNKTSKREYLRALSAEIKDTQTKALDSYLRDFCTPSSKRMQLLDTISSIQGLDGTNVVSDVGLDSHDPAVQEQYLAFYEKRNAGLPHDAYGASRHASQGADQATPENQAPAGNLSAGPSL
jgi:cell filamentation protein